MGYQALIDILIDIIKEVKEDSDRDKIETYERYLNKAKDKVNILDNERYPFTSKSRTRFYLDLNLAIWPPLNLNDERIYQLRESLRE